MDSRPQSNLLIAAPSHLPKKPVGVEVGAGAYTDIISISGPSEVAEGEWVNLDVAVKNTWTSSFYITITGSYDGTDIYPSIDYLTIQPGETLHFYFAFKMPNRDIRVDFWSWFWATDDWYQDDSQAVTVKLKQPQSPEFASFGITEYNKI